MKSIPVRDFLQNAAMHNEVVEALTNGDLICFPTPSGYKLAVQLSSQAAVSAIIQAKRRVNNAPALVLVPDMSWVEKIVESIQADARQLMTSLWPGPLTLLFEPNGYLSPQITKPLTKAKGWLGFRVPDDEISAAILKTFGQPLLVSSANLSKKNGATSVAQVKKNFGRTAALLIDAGDIKEGPKSTLVDMTRSIPAIVRQGAISEESIRHALAC